MSARLAGESGVERESMVKINVEAMFFQSSAGGERKYKVVTGLIDFRILGLGLLVCGQRFVLRSGAGRSILAGLRCFGLRLHFLHTVVCEVYEIFFPFTLHDHGCGGTLNK